MSTNTAPIPHRAMYMNNEQSFFSHNQQQNPVSNSITQQTQSSSSPLHGIRILIAIAAFDFSQIPHLEEVIDSYQGLCVTGAAKVDVIIHATVPYPVTLIDLWNSRLLPSCRGIFSLQIVLKPSSLRLHLVDCHRELFYSKLDDYDLFIYTEDDIRVTPATVGAYLAETKRVQELVGFQRSMNFNVGIVRYEYNWPNNVVIDDKTRHATQNVTRVYWEHGRYPVFTKAVDFIADKELHDTHLQMTNHHQGMFLATHDLLKAWRDKKGCDFDKVRDRPGFKNRPSQPSEGTQRVWMSSQMLYGGKHCNVQQVLPVDAFGTLTVLHLPNKNYRRVGHFRNRTFSDGTEQFDHGLSAGLLTAMMLHLEIQKNIPQAPRIPYDGITMVDEVGNGRDRTPLLERRMSDYQAYVDRGGVLSAKDIMHTALYEEQ
ncbi:hypothetical protein IV203_002897 [Nitzschia inconspicua]|uniref:Uncharacterized protein n=1 Tax=Nitzschia inconspicua TaxID=303405 RepID=A0A9K3L1A0_9STRA|nr:hypothetical protein IV203_002897 [Nitzschia inconspicua]